MSGPPGDAPRLTAVVVALDEAERLGGCLARLAFCDEVLVVDGGSRDATADVARRHGARVLERAWDGFAAQRNFAFGAARGAWILAVDADEEVPPELAREIRELVDAGEGHGMPDGFAVARRYMVGDRWLRRGGLWPDWQLRLFRRTRGSVTARAVHETVSVPGQVGRLRGALLHRSFRGVGDFVQRHERYATLAAMDAFQRGARAGTLELVARPCGRFFAMYVLRRGFLDGAPGLLLASLYAYYVFMRTAKLWEASRL